MNKNLTKRKFITSLIWKMMERGGTQGIQFIVQIILARLLLPDDFGTVAIVMVFISIAQVFVQTGFNTALIQKKDADNLDFSSIFYFSIIIAGFLYAIAYLLAPIISNFYNEPQLTPLLRVLSIILFLGAFNSVQNAYISRNMLFKNLFISSLGGILISGIIGIIAAYFGLGVWALILQQLSNQLIISIIMWFTVKWRPELMFSFKRVKSMFSFSSKLLISALINTIYLDIRTLVIGKTYNPSILGYYNRGQQMPKVFVTLIDGSIQSVILPTLSSFQDDTKRLKDIVRRSIMTSSFFIFPMMLGLAVVSEPLIKIILTEKWLPSVPFMQIYCMSYMFMPIHTSNLQVLNAMGRSDIFLKLEVLKKVIGILILVVSMQISIYAIALGALISNIIFSFINAFPNKRMLDYTYKEQISDVLPSLIVSLIMASIVHIIGYIELATWKVLTIQVIMGIFIYFYLSKLMKLESFNYIEMTIRQFNK